MTEQTKHKHNHTVFYFNSSNSQIRNSGQLKGYKLKSQSEDKIYTLKTRYVQRLNIQKSKSFFNQQQPATERQKISYQNFRYRSFSKRLHPNKRPIVNQSNIIITSQSNSLPKQIRPRQFPSFTSSNLQGKMNQYLNIIIKKSHDNHKQKLKKLSEIEKQPKHVKVQNIFLRRMKMGQNKRKDSKNQMTPEQASASIQVLNNIKKVVKKSHSSFQEAKK